MYITFLGTGPSQAIPRKGHRDALCRDARRGGKSRRLRSAVLVASGKTTILIDAGPDITQQLKKAKPRRIDAVLITHGHEDAIGGLKDLDVWLDAMDVKDAEDARCVVPVYTDKLTAERLTKRFGAFRNLSFVALKDYKAIRIPSPSVIPALRPPYGGQAGIQKKRSQTDPRVSSDSPKDDNIKVIPVPVLHTRDARQIKTYGYLFESFCYASDFYALPERTKSLFKNLKTLILDGAMYLGVKMPTHMSADATVRLAAELRAKRLLLTQTGHTYPPHDQAERAIRRYVRTLGSPYPKTVSLAFDGMRLVV